MRLAKVIFLIYLLSFSLTQLSANYRENFNFGKRMYNDGFYNEAINVFQSVVRVAPDSPEAEESLYYIAMAHLNNQRYQESIDVFNRLRSNYPNTRFIDEILFYSGRLYQLTGNYSESIKNYGELINSHPGSSFISRTLHPYLLNYQKLGEFDEVILIGNQLIRTFDQQPDTPNILYLIAHAYEQKNMNDQAKITAQRVIDNYPSHNAKWDAIRLITQLKIKEDNTMEAISLLETALSGTVPRIYEEELRNISVKLYSMVGDYHTLAAELNLMITKFDRSELLDQYLYQLFEVSLVLNRYSEIIELYDSHLKVISQSPNQKEMLFYTASAYYHLNQYSRAEEIISDILKSHDLSIDLSFQARKLLAEIMQATQRYRAAIDLYITLINLYPQLTQRSEVFSRIGDMYRENFMDFNTAIHFYRQAFNSVSRPESQAALLLKISDCYEELQNYDEALQHLKRINLALIDDPEKKNFIQQKKSYLYNHKVVDFAATTNNLLNSMIIFLSNDDKTSLRNSLLSILLYDMKDYTNAQSLINSIDDPEILYYKALVSYRLAGKNLHEGNVAAYDAHISNLSIIMEDLNGFNDEQYRKLTIKKLLLENSNLIIPEIEQKITNFLESYPDNAYAEDLIIMLAKHYSDTFFYDKASQYIEILDSDRVSGNSTFQRVVLVLADHYYQQNQFDKSLELMNRIKDFININNAEVFYKYSVLLHRAGETRTAIENLTFLIHNTPVLNYEHPPFPDFYNALEYLAELHRSNENYELALSTLLLTPQPLRTDRLYRILAKDYYELNNLSRAREMLMHVVEKSLEDLRLLAELHLANDDYVLGEYTYDLLFKEETQANYKQIAKQMLGHINYRFKKYAEAMNHFNYVLEHIPDRFNREEFSYLDLDLLAKESIISLYKLQNRPRAESVSSKFRQVLNSNPNVQNEVKLAEAIYNTGVNRRNAHRLLSNLINDSSAADNIRYQAYFWRGINFLENKEVDNAKSDFLQAYGSKNLAIQNESALKLGTISFSEEQYQRALEYYSFVIENDQYGELAFDAAKNFAIVAKTIEEWEKAIAAYNIILDKWGDRGLEAETIFNIGFCYYRNRQYQEAIDMFERSLRLLNERELKAEAQYWIGESYLGLNQFENSITAFLIVSYSYSEFVHWAAVSDLKVGEIYIRQNQPDQARQMLENIIRKYGESSDWGKQATILLQQI